MNNSAIRSLSFISSDCNSTLHFPMQMNTAALMQDWTYSATHFHICSCKQEIGMHMLIRGWKPNVNLTVYFRLNCVLKSGVRNTTPRFFKESFISLILLFLLLFFIFLGQIRNCEATIPKLLDSYTVPLSKQTRLNFQKGLRGQTFPHI